MPVSTAELRARQCCTSARAASPVIHWLSPFASAVRPSRLMRELHAHEGRPCAHALDEPGVQLAAPRLPSAPIATSMPAARSASAPCPLTCGIRIAQREHHARDAGLDQRHPCTAACGRDDCRLERDIRGGAARLRHRPRCSAATSACGSPARSCQPSPTMRSPRAMHAADARIRLGGLQSRVAASSSARVMATRSKSENMRSRLRLIHLFAAAVCRPSRLVRGSSGSCSRSAPCLALRACARRCGC